MKQRRSPPTGEKGSIPAAKIVGIGASAGGLEAFTELLRNLPLDSGIAYILVQHLDPSHRSLLSELLARTTPLRVREIIDNTPVEANQIYVIPPNSDLALERGVLKLSPRDKTGGPARSIDHFLTSLAIDQKANAVAVILSGAGSDGSQGLRAVKAAGGITFAQDDRTAKYDSMPRASIATGCVDFVLPPEKIAGELARLIRNPGSFKSRAAANAKSRRGQMPAKSRFERRPQNAAPWPSAPGHSSLHKIFQLLRAKTGLDFTFYKSNTIRRRLARRMSLNKVTGLKAYLKHLRHHAEELDLLHQDLLIGVTSFFRNPSVFEQLKQKVFSRLVKNLSGSDTVRMWVAGCSSGQEAYSLAIAYSEFAEKSEIRVPVQIFASDVNGSILEFARAGRYGAAEVEALNTARKERFFIREDGHYRVIKAIRDLVVFAQHNVLLDPPFTRVDLISCRNMLIYFEPALQQKLIPAFHYSLKPNGILLLGSSESVGQFHNLFASLEQKHRIYVKKPAPNWPRFERPALVPPTTHSSRTRAAGPPEINPADAQKEADRVVLQKYSPAGVLVNDEGEILQFRGDVGKYFKLPMGRASFHLSKIARDGLALQLERVFAKARREKKAFREKAVCLDGRQGLIDIEVIPLKLGWPCYLVLFAQPVPVPKPAAGKAPRKGRAAGPESKQLVELKQELLAAREHINSLQEEHDTSVEELQASNEEVQSANEELQSLNEELETSNEELESANEELTTLNEELATRNAELRESEMRLREQAALLEMAPLLARSTKDRIIFWSRGAQALYGYTPEEAVGQSAHILLDTRTREPMAGIQAKLHAQGHWEGEVTHRRKDGKILSVATQWVVHHDNQKKIRAILEVNTDITARNLAQRALLETEEFNRTILESSPDCIKVLDVDGRVIFVNPVGRELIEAGDSEVRARSYWPGLWMGEGREQAEKAYREALLGRTSRFAGFRLTPKGTPKWWDVVVRPINGAEAKPERLLAVLRDITEHKKQEMAIMERARLTTLRAQIASECAGDAPLQPVLQRISEILARDLHLAVVQVWSMDDKSLELTLQASVGTRTSPQSTPEQLPAGASALGQIAQRRNPCVITDLQKHPELKPEAAIDNSLVSFVGYPLTVGKRRLGVMAAYNKTPMTETELEEISYASNGVGQFVFRKLTDQQLRAAQAELSRYNVGLEKLAAERTASLQQLVEQMEEFSYSISHDLRAPARAMEGYASALLEDYGERLDATGKDYLERIMRSSSRMDRMIREILTYSRMGRGEISLTPVQLDSLVREVVEQYPGIQPFSQGIEIAGNLGSVMGHEPSLMQAISNLLSNACKFVAANTPPRCKVWSERNNGHVILFVKDNGIGIKPEHHHRLFGVFERIHPESSYEGNGIGLAIVRKAVERMGGRVGVESDGVNGSQFWIQLPAPDKKESA